MRIIRMCGMAGEGSHFNRALSVVRRISLFSLSPSLARSRQKEGLVLRVEEEPTTHPQVVHLDP